METTQLSESSTQVELLFSSCIRQSNFLLCELYDDLLREGYLHAGSFHYVKRRFPVSQNVEYGVIHSYAAREKGTNQFRFLTRKPFGTGKKGFVYGYIPISKSGTYSEKLLTKASYHSQEAELCMLTEVEYERLRKNSLLVKSSLNKLRMVQVGEHPIELTKLEVKGVTKSDLPTPTEVQQLAYSHAQTLTTLLRDSIEHLRLLAIHYRSEHFKRLHKILTGKALSGLTIAHDLQNSHEDEDDSLESSLSSYPTASIQIDIKKRSDTLYIQFYMRELSHHSRKYIRIGLPTSNVGYSHRAFDVAHTAAEAKLCFQTEEKFRVIRKNALLLKTILKQLGKMTWSL